MVTPALDETISFYAFLDSIELPADEGDYKSKKANFVFDAIKVQTFESGQHKPDNAEDRPLIRIYTTLDILKQLIKAPLDEGRWYLLTISSKGSGPRAWLAKEDPASEVGFSEFATGFLVDRDVKELKTEQDSWLVEETRESQLNSVYQVIRPISKIDCNMFDLDNRDIKVTAIDVGQANFCVVTINNYPLIYYDVGFPLWFHKSTLPKKVCYPQTPMGIVVLSHWDFDHYARAYTDANLKNLIWVTPEFIGGPNGYKFAHSLRKHVTVNPNTIIKGPPWIECGWGQGTEKNDKCLIVVINSNGRRVLLPGDTSFRHIPSSLQTSLSALTIPHHASLNSHISPPQPRGNSEYRAVACAGQRNRYGHPVSQVLTSYQNHGWKVELTGRQPGFRRGNKVL